MERSSVDVQNSPQQNLLNKWSIYKYHIYIYISDLGWLWWIVQNLNTFMMNLNKTVWLLEVFTGGDRSFFDISRLENGEFTIKHGPFTINKCEHVVISAGQKTRFKAIYHENECVWILGIPYPIFQWTFHRENGKMRFETTGYLGDVFKARNI
jgi:hypothetical protein